MELHKNWYPSAVLAAAGFVSVVVITQACWHLAFFVVNQLLAHGVIPADRYDPFVFYSPTFNFIILVVALVTVVAAAKIAVWVFKKLVAGSPSVMVVRIATFFFLVLIAVSTIGQNITYYFGSLVGGILLAGWLILPPILFIGTVQRSTKA